MTAQLFEAQAIAQLHSIFPDRSKATLQAILTQHDFNLELSIASLLAEPEQRPIKVLS